MKKPEYGSFLEMFKSSKVNEKEFIETIEKFIKGIISWYRYVCKDDTKANERKDFLYSATQLNLMTALHEIKNDLYSGFPTYPFFNEEFAEYTWLGVATEDYSSFLKIYLEEFVRSFSRELKNSIILFEKKWRLCLFERILEYKNIYCYMQKDVEACEFIDKIFEKTAQ
ncbi:MAG: hypothetical protein LUH47_07905, partial [Clostridiales bacterium]|nr:hypothetical protein [Clostridiales bacterium]